MNACIRINLKCLRYGVLMKKNILKTKYNFKK